MDFSTRQAQSIMDVALLKPPITTADAEAFAKVIRDEGFGFACVNSIYVGVAVDVLKGSRSKVVACVGFPHPHTKTEVKVLETELSVRDGANEIDMVIDLGGLVGGDFKRVEDDIRGVVAAAQGRPVKVIIETPLLSTQQKRDASLLVRDSGAAFVKSCTGFSADPAALYEDIRLIRQTVGPEMGVKASGRIADYLRFVSMVEAGANRIGLSLPGAREIVRGCTEVQSG